MKKLFSLFVLFFILVFLWVILFFLYPTTSPFTAGLYSIESLLHPHKTMSQSITAFLPYWRIDDTKYAHFDTLSEINYFALTIDANGNFQKVSGNQTEPGWRWWHSQTIKDLIAKTQVSGGKFTVTVTAQKNAVIEAFLSSTSAQNTFMANTIQELTTRHLNGITLDFEYNGTPDDSLIQQFTDFSNRLASTLHAKIPQATLSLTLLPLAGREEKSLFDLPKLASIYNRFIGMSYDYYASNSEIAGPVAPMNGFAENKYFFDVATTYTDFLKVIPASKILMGVPYYGWDWAVVDGKTIQSKTLPESDPNNYSAVLSYARMRENKDLKSNRCTWDEYAKETWCWYTDSKNIDHQVWFEDNKSIGLKFDFAKKNNFAGIAIWTLGYDNGYPDLWNLLLNTFSKK